MQLGLALDRVHRGSHSIFSSTSVTSPGLAARSGQAAVALHPGDDGLADPRLSSGTSAGANQDPGRGRRLARARRRSRRRGGPVASANFAALTSASRVAATNASLRASTSRSPTTTATRAAAAAGDPGGGGRGHPGARGEDDEDRRGGLSGGVGPATSGSAPTSAIARPTCAPRSSCSASTESRSRRSPRPT